MSPDLVADLVRQTLLLTLALALPPLVAIWLAGLGVGVLQIVSGLQDASLSFVPRVLVAFAAWAAASPWILAELRAFSEMIWAFSAIG